MGSIPGLARWVKDPALLWLWHRPAAVAPTEPLAWEPPYAVGAALTSQKKKKERERERKKERTKERTKERNLSRKCKDPALSQLRRSQFFHLAFTTKLELGVR